MSWDQTTSPSFTARHDERDQRDAVSVLELLEGTRERLADAFATLPDQVDVVLHPSLAGVSMAQPLLPVVRRLTEPASRRYLNGWYSLNEIHVLAPRRLTPRVANVTGLREMLLLSPAALYTQLVVAANNPGLPPPFRPRSFVRYLRWAWLAAGSGQYFSGQTVYARSAIARRLRDGHRPRFPPSVPDALLLGGSLFDLAAAERGEQAAVDLACELPPGGVRQALLRAFGGLPMAEIEVRWREHLNRLATP